MNIYLLVEGRQTEKKIYPAWISYAVPELTKVDKPEDAIENNFYIISGNGYPNILKFTKDAIATVNELGSLYSHLVVVLDSDGKSPQAMREEIERIEQETPLLPHIKLEIIVQHSCIETWFLGNASMMPQTGGCEELQGCRSFYDVSVDDPELMHKPDGIAGSVAHYHERYLKHLLRNQAKPLSYNKAHPGITRDVTYWQELVARHENTAHMVNFGAVVRFFSSLQTQLQES